MHVKKPLITKNKAATNHSCPNCNVHILRVKGMRASGQKVNYCPDCGQELDWTDVEIETYWPM